MEKEKIRKGMTIIVNGKDRKVKIGERGGFYVDYEKKRHRRHSAWSFPNAPKSDVKAITLTFTKHQNYSAFESCYEDSENRTDDQGWYVLGSTKYVGYIGIVGDVRNGVQAQGATFVSRWEAHDAEGKKFPKKFMKNNRVKIKNQNATLHTCSVKVAKERSSPMPPLIRRGANQAKLIKSVEKVIVSALAKRYHDKNKKPTSFYKKRGTRWVGGKQDPDPVDFSGSKTLINVELLGPPENLMYSGDFNVRIQGTTPLALSKEFDNGIYAKDLMAD